MAKKVRKPRAWENLKPGEIAVYRRDDGSLTEHVVKYAPWQIGSGQWLVGLRGISGGVAAHRVRPADRSEPSDSVCSHEYGGIEMVDIGRNEHRRVCIKCNAIEPR